MGIVGGGCRDVISKLKVYIKTWRHGFVELDYQLIHGSVSFIFRLIVELKYSFACILQALCQRI